MDVQAGALGLMTDSEDLISVVCSMVKGSLVTGSVPLSSTHFSNKRFSNTWPEMWETTGVSGMSPDIAQTIDMVFFGQGNEKFVSKSRKVRPT